MSRFCGGEYVTFLGTTWGLLGDYLGTTGGLLGDYLGTTWELLGDYLGTTWGLLGDYLGTIWGLLVDYLGTTWGLSGDYLFKEHIYWGKCYPQIQKIQTNPNKSKKSKNKQINLRWRTATSPYEPQLGRVSCAGEARLFLFFSNIDLGH